MEGRDRAAHAERLGGRVAAGPVVTVGEQLVQLPTERLVERRDRADALVEVADRFHGRSLKHKLVDATPPSLTYTLLTLERKPS